MTKQTNSTISPILKKALTVISVSALLILGSYITGIGILIGIIASAISGAAYLIYQTISQNSMGITPPSVATDKQPSTRARAASSLYVKLPYEEITLLNGKTIKIAPFKVSTLEPYGPLANTTKGVTYPVPQEFGGKTYTWPSSEHAFHAQKILFLLDQEAFKDNTELKEFLKILESTQTTGEFHPRDDWDRLVLDLISQNPGVFIDKKYTDKKDILQQFAIKTGSATFPLPRRDDKKVLELKSKPGSTDSTGTPHSTNFMRKAIQLKLKKHESLRKMVMEMAREGIIPVEVSWRDQSWASGKEGDGFNRLGILYLEEGNRLLQQAGEAVVIEYPSATYEELRKGARGQLKHDVLVGKQFSQKIDVEGITKGITTKL